MERVYITEERIYSVSLVALRIWDAHSGKCLRIIGPYRNLSLRGGIHSQYLVCSLGENFCVFDRRSGKLVSEFDNRFGERRTYSLFYIDDNKMIFRAFQDTSLGAENSAIPMEVNFKVLETKSGKVLGNYSIEDAEENWPLYTCSGPETRVSLVKREATCFLDLWDFNDVSYNGGQEIRDQLAQRQLDGSVTEESHSIPKEGNARVIQISVIFSGIVYCLFIASVSYFS